MTQKHEICPALLRPEIERILVATCPEDVPGIVQKFEGNTDPILLGVYSFHAVWLQNGRRVYDLAAGVPERLMSVDPQWGTVPFSGVIRLPSPLWLKEKERGGPEGTESKKLGLIAFYFIYNKKPETDVGPSEHLCFIVPQFLDESGDNYWGGIIHYQESGDLPQDARTFRLAINAVYALTNERIGKIVPMSLGFSERRKRMKYGQQMACRRLELPESAHHVFTTVRDVVRAKPVEPSPEPPPATATTDPAQEIPTSREATAVSPHKGLRWMVEDHCTEGDILQAIDQRRYQERPGKPLLIGIPRPIKGHVRGKGQIKSHAARVVLAKD